MMGSESGPPHGSPENETPDRESQAEAQRAADGLKGQIAALRARVKAAQARLRDGEPRRDREPRSFKR
jgi:hypothetical protein